MARGGGHFEARDIGLSPPRSKTVLARPVGHCKRRAICRDRLGLFAS
jgi:hypothetical protein